MTTHLIRALLALPLLVLGPAAAGAQGVEFGLDGTGLVSIQPVDDSYVGSPYLSEGIGGIAPGFGAAASVISPNGFTAAVEFSTARFALEQEGRLVGGSGTTRLHDSLLSVLIGFTQPAGNTRAQVLFGAGASLDSPTVDGNEVVAGPTGSDSVLPFAPTGGISVIQSISARAAIVVGARYAYIGRVQNVRFLGIGPHVLRVGAGLRVRLH